MDGLSGFQAAVTAGRRSLAKRRVDTTSRLGDVLGRMIAPLQAAHKKTTQIEEEWAGVVPSDVAGHCRIQRIEQGQLHVAADSPVYAYELRMCSQDLLRQMRRRCPRLGLRTIKVTVA